MSGSLLLYDLWSDRTKVSLNVRTQQAVHIYRLHAAKRAAALETHHISRSQFLITVVVYGRIMHEKILLVGVDDESIAFFVVKPPYYPVQNYQLRLPLFVYQI